MSRLSLFHFLLPFTLLYQASIQAQNITTAEGNTIVVNGKTWRVAWRKWTENNIVHFAMTDPDSVFGTQSLSNRSLEVQPVQWFTQTWQLPVIFNYPSRYLDLTELIKANGIESEVTGNSLLLKPPLATIKEIQEDNKSLVIVLDKPTIWQVQQDKVTLRGLPIANPQNTANFSLEVTPNNTQIKANLPTGCGLRVTGLQNPTRIVMEIRPDAMLPKTIKWSPGVTLHQDYITISTGNVFPVTYLEIDPKTTNLTLRPLLSNAQVVVGLTSVVSMAESGQALVAINGGFFNRNTQQPLGGLKREGIWISSPILNRGAIAWDAQGNFELGRLSLKETISTSPGVTLPIVGLNSGYLQAGLSRYTQSWGSNYTPTNDQETVFRVENGTIKEQILTSPTKTPIKIPLNGYLLVSKGENTPSLQTNSQVQLTSQTIPSSFDKYPNIIAAGPLLLQEGEIVLDAESEHFNPFFQKQNASRSGIAVTSKGTILMIAVHNRLQGDGPNLTELAQLLQGLGATDALNLDGGSSTSLYLGGKTIDQPPTPPAKVNNGLGLFFTP